MGWAHAAAPRQRAFAKKTMETRMKPAHLNRRQALTMPLALRGSAAGPIDMSHTEMTTFVARDFKYWGEVVRAANIKPE
jgi:hypothetical protein